MTEPKAKRLQAKQLSGLRNHKPLFQNLDFEVRSGQLLLVEGKNGAGKTSLLKLLSGLRLADKGDILWNGQAITAPDCDFRQSLAWLGHNNPLKEEQTALENLEMLGNLRTRNQQCALQALAKVGLGKFKHKLVKTFSAGMKRRLALASLLIADTPLWILDEPQTALDKHGIVLFERMASQHLENGGLIVMTSHHEIGIAKKFVQRLSLGF